MHYDFISVPHIVVFTLLLLSPSVLFVIDFPPWDSMVDFVKLLLVKVFKETGAKAYDYRTKILRQVVLYPSML